MVLFIIFIDRTSRCSQVVEGVKFGGLWITSLLFADDVVLLSSSNSDLKLALGWFAAEVKAAGMRISASKSRVHGVHGSHPEKGGLTTLGRGRVTSPSGGVQVSRGLGHE